MKSTSEVNEVTVDESDEDNNDIMIINNMNGKFDEEHGNDHDDCWFWEIVYMINNMTNEFCDDNDKSCVVMAT